MTCDTGYIIFPPLILGCILWPLIFPPPAAYPGRSHASSEDGKRCVTSAQVTAPNATWSVRRSDGGVWSKVRERVAVPCSSLFARCPHINVWLHYFPPLTTQVAQFLTLKFASSPALVIFCLPTAFDAFVALFAFVFVGGEWF